MGECIAKLVSGTVAWVHLVSPVAARFSMVCQASDRERPKVKRFDLSIVSSSSLSFFSAGKIIFVEREAILKSGTFIFMKSSVRDLNFTRRPKYCRFSSREALLG